VWAPSEGASKRTPYILRRDLVGFNAWSLNYAISEILLAHHNVDRSDLVILDRGPFDSLAWMGVLKERSQLSENEYDIIRAYALHRHWMSKLALIFLLTCTPAISMSREHESKLITRPGIAMNEEMPSALLEQYTRLKNESTELPVFSRDTSKGTSPLSTTFEIATEILSALERTKG
jgi:hypothetical protein